MTHKWQKSQMGCSSLIDCFILPSSVYEFHIAMRKNVTTLRRDERNLEAVIDALHYDFTAFDIQHFLTHLQQYRQRPIILGELSFDSELHGMWVPEDDVDYLFVSGKLLPFHRVHTLLHESAHMLLNHTRIDLSKVFPEALAKALDIQSPKGHLRSGDTLDNDDDEEAERFVMLIQQRVTEANRLRELFGEPTSLSAMTRYVRPLDYNR